MSCVVGGNGFNCSQQDRGQGPLSLVVRIHRNVVNTDGRAELSEQFRLVNKETVLGVVIPERALLQDLKKGHKKSVRPKRRNSHNIFR